MKDFFYGTGIKLYGKEKTRSDGSYIATKWIVFAYIPLVPLGSFLVKPTGKDYETFESSSLMTARVKWQKQHVFNVYAAMGLLATILLTFTYISRPWLSIKAAETESFSPSQQTNSGYVRPLAAPNGSPLPSFSAYIKGYDKLANEGYAQMTINNKENDSDLYAKLYVLDREITEPVRVFLVKAKGYFIVDSLDAGDYELRYQNLDTGELNKTDRLSLEKTEANGGFYFTHTEVTLSRVINGNLRTEPISEKDF